MNLLTVIGVTDWMFKMIRSLFITIDRVVYAWIENCYELLIKLSESGIFSQSTIQEFANFEIYPLLDGNIHFAAIYPQAVSVFANC